MVICMNNKKIVISALILFGIGALFHFVYDWIDIKSLAWLFPVNESIFEHTKLVFLPYTLYYLCLFILRKDKLSSLMYRCNLSIIVATICEVVLYYTISGILGSDVPIINMSILYISFVISLSMDTKVDRNESHNLACTSMVYLSMLFFVIVMTYYPFDIAFFYDYNSNKYSI